MKSFSNIWTSLMHIVRHRVQLTITSSIRKRTFQVKMRHTCGYYLRPLWIDCREFFSIGRRLRIYYFIRWTTTTKSFQIIEDLSKLQNEENSEFYRILWIVIKNYKKQLVFSSGFDWGIGTWPFFAKWRVQSNGFPRDKHHLQFCLAEWRSN